MLILGTGPLAHSGLFRLKQTEELYGLQEKWFGLRMKLPDRVPSFE